MRALVAEREQLVLDVRDRHAQTGQVEGAELPLGDLGQRAHPPVHLVHACIFAQTNGLRHRRVPVGSRRYAPRVALGSDEDSRTDALSGPLGPGDRDRVAVRLRGDDPDHRGPHPLREGDRAEHGEDRERRQERAGHGQADHHRDVPFEPLEVALGELGAGGLRLGAHVADAERDHERQQRKRRLQPQALAGERPEQAPEQDHVGDAIEDGIEERTPAAGLASETSHGAVQDVEQPGGDQQQPGEQELAAQEGGSDPDVRDEPEHRQVPRPESGPVDPEQDDPVRPREDPAHRPSRHAFGESGRRHVADARRLDRLVGLGSAHLTPVPRLSPRRRRRHPAQSLGSKATTR